MSASASSSLRSPFLTLHPCFHYLHYALASLEILLKLASPNFCGSVTKFMGPFPVHSFIHIIHSLNIYWRPTKCKAYSPNTRNSSDQNEQQLLSVRKILPSWRPLSSFGMLKHLWQSLNWNKAPSTWPLGAKGFNPSTWEGEKVDLCEFKASLIYTVGSMLVRAVQWDPVSK